MPTNNSTNNSSLTPFIVGPLGSAPYLTIQSALDGANAIGGGAIYLQPGTYTEDLTLYDKTCIVGITPLETLVNDAVSDIILSGIHTPPSSGYFTFSSLILESTTDIFNSSVAGTASLSILDCNVMLTDGYVFNLPNWAGALYINFMGESSSTSGFINNVTGSSSVTVHDAHVGSFNSSKTMQIPGSATFIRTEIRCPVLTNGNFSLYYCTSLDSITFSNGCNALIYFSFLTKFGAPVINNNSSGGGGHIISMSTFNGFNNPIIGGTGTDALLIQGCTFFGSSTISGSFSVIYKPWTVAFGGTGISSATANGVIIGGTASDSAFQVVGPGTAGQVLTSNGPSDPPTMQDNGSGSGDVVGPASATDNAICRYDGTTGKLIKNSSVTIDNSGNLLISVGNGSVTRSASGSNVALTAQNNSNTASSDAHFEAIVAGPSAGNPLSLYTVMSGSSWAAGINNANSDAYTISLGGILGTQDSLVLGTDGSALVKLGNFSVTRSASGSAVVSAITNTSNTASSDARFVATVAGTSSGNAFSLYTITSGNSWATGAHTASGAYKISLGGALGTGDALVVNDTGLVQVPLGDLTVTRSNSGGPVAFEVLNSSNTAGSDAAFQAFVDGSSAGDPYFQFTVNGITNFTHGIDNDDSDSYKISASNTLGTSDVFVATTGGQVILPQQTSFFAYQSANATNVTGDNTIYSPIFDQFTQVGSAYNNSTGIFTAPVTAWYGFSCTITIANIGIHNFGYIGMAAGANIWRGNMLSPTTCQVSGNLCSYVISIERVYLTAAQTAQPLIVIGGSTKTITVSGNNAGTLFTFFSGGLKN